MNIASLDLCTELYEVSGWKNTSEKWRKEMFKGGYVLTHSPAGYDNTPAYDLGFMLRKLPRKLKGVNSKQRDGNFNLYASRGKGAWVASYADEDSSIIRRLKKDAETQNNRNFWFLAFSADTPEDAACKLLCELIKQGTIQPREGLK